MLFPRRLRLIVQVVQVVLAVLCARTQGQPTFSANDHLCYMNLHAAQDPAADLDGNGEINANDFIAFLRLYAELDPRANCDGSVAKVEGWTDLTAPAGANVYYIAANGNDADPGTLVLPFRTLARGYLALRAGHPDQCLLRRGDTFNEAIDLSKGSGSVTSYMVIGSYGSGPRPKVRSNATAFNGGARNVTGLAIVDLDIAPVSGGGDQYSTSIWLADGWTNVLVEGCLLSGYQVNLVSHETGTGHITGLKLRRNVIVDSTSFHPGHSGGIFLGSQHELLIEENVFDRNGRQGEQTIFRHNVYIHDFGSSNVTFRGNTTARACATGVQQRPGGLSENNLLLQNAIGHTWGGDVGMAAGGFRHNVCIDARDINPVDRRGIAYSLSGSGTVEYNIAAYQVSGTDAIVAFNMEGFNGGTVRGNYVYDWGSTGNHGWESALQWDGGSGAVMVTGNRFTMPTVGMMNRHESRGVAGFTYSGNTYYTSTPSGGVGGYLPFSRLSGQGLDWNGWRGLVGEAGSVYLSKAPVDPHIRVGEYLAAIGIVPGADPIATYMAETRLQSKQNWRDQLTAAAFNTWARARAGVP